MICLSDARRIAKDPNAKPCPACQAESARDPRQEVLDALRSYACLNENEAAIELDSLQSLPIPSGHNRVVSQEIDRLTRKQLEGRATYQRERYARGKKRKQNEKSPY